MRKLMFALAWRSVALWVIPVLISFAAFDRTGKLLIEEQVFTTLMTISFSASSTWALRGALFLPTHLQPALTIARYAMMCGCIYFLVCCLLDIILLVPFINTNDHYAPLTPTSWFYQMGMGYTTVILQAYLAGIVADKANGAKIDETTNLTTTRTITDI